MLKQEPARVEPAVRGSARGEALLGEPGERPASVRAGVRKWLLMAAGVGAVVLGTVGIVVPLLPTTPFLLLAAACFVRSSDRLYRWLLGHRWLGPYVRNYREHHAISGPLKAVTLILLWASLGYAVVGLVESPLVRGVLVLIGVSVTVHVLRLQTLPRGLRQPDRS
jgi:uncharacterized membrane protein YbaN (DUF454 family)